jgi:hypothetical protein
MRSTAAAGLELSLAAGVSEAVALAEESLETAILGGREGVEEGHRHDLVDVDDHRRDRTGRPAREGSGCFDPDPCEPARR